MESRVHDDIIVIVTRAHIVIVTSLLLRLSFSEQFALNKDETKIIQSRNVLRI